MWIGWLGSLALTLSLLFAATAGVADHDHTPGIERAGYDCTVDHARDDGPWSPDPELRAGKQHFHQCLACKQGGHRVLLASFRAVFGPTPCQERSFELRPAPQPSVSWTGRTLRGPPSA